MARQAADRGHGTLLTNQKHSKVYSLCLEGGGNIIIDTTATLHKAPTQIAAATMGYLFEPSTDPQHKGSLTYPDNIRAEIGQIKGMKTGLQYFGFNEVGTYPIGEPHFRNIPITKVDLPIPDEERLRATPRPLMHDTTTPQEINPREGWAAQALDTTLQASHLPPKTTTYPESNTVTARVKRERRGKLTKPTGLPDTSHSEPTTGQRLPEKHPDDPDTALDLEPTDHTATINKNTAENSPKPHLDSNHELQADIYLQTPTGGCVPWQDVNLELNPYSKACRDTSGLMGITHAMPVFLKCDDDFSRISPNLVLRLGLVLLCCWEAAFSDYQIVHGLPLPLSLTLTPMRVGTQGTTLS